MTPFQEFRFWARRAPAGERAAAAIAGIVVAGLLVFILVPGGGTSSTTVGTSGGVAAGQGAAADGSATNPAGAGAGSVAATGLAGQPGARTGSGSGATGGSVSGGGTAGVAPGANGTGPAGSPTAAGAAATAKCPPQAAGVPGVTATQIKIAITLTNIVGPAANGLFGVPSTSQQQADYQGIIDSINSTGGVACRKIAAQFFLANPTDGNDLQQKCLDISAAGVFAELDSGSYADRPIIGCFAQHHVPYFGAYLFAASVQSKFYPYLFNFNTFDSLYHNTIFALKDRGFFAAGDGFKKLGFVYKSCYPQIIGEMTGWLQQAGVPSSAIVTYDLGCPSALANPSDIQQAVLKFQQNGVTHVTTADMVADFSNFTTIAQQQGFRPKYGLADDSLIPLNSGSQHPDFANVANAIAISASRDGEDQTPGLTPTPGTARCNAIYQAHGQPPVYQQAAFAGNACDELWMFAAAAGHAAVLAPTALVAGLQSAGSVDFSYPQGPNSFAGNGVTTGGQFWRPTQFMSKCNCWQVIDSTFHPSYP